MTHFSLFSLWLGPILLLSFYTDFLCQSSHFFSSTWAMVGYHSSLPVLWHRIQFGLELECIWPGKRQGSNDNFSKYPYVYIYYICVRDPSAKNGIRKCSHINRSGHCLITCWHLMTTECTVTQTSIKMSANNPYINQFLASKNNSFSHYINVSFICTWVVFRIFFNSPWKQHPS